MISIKMFLAAAAGAFIVKETVLAVADILWAVRSRRARSANREQLFTVHRIGDGVVDAFCGGRKNGAGNAMENHRTTGGAK